MTVLKDEGVYRHLSLRFPRASREWCEVVTWPGCSAPVVAFSPASDESALGEAAASFLDRVGDRAERAA
jgi:hypothetical protein